MSTTKRADLIQGVADIIADYRAGEIPQPDAAHVERWIGQFQPEVQEPLLAEMMHVLNAMYITKDVVLSFLKGLVTNPKLTGDDHRTFWKNANMLSAQANGNSQREMLAEFGEILKEVCGLGLSECGSAEGACVYIDDAIFTGNRVTQDIKDWLARTGQVKFDLHIIVIAYHSGAYRVKSTIEEYAKSLGKEIDVHLWRALELENRKAHRERSEVLWPVSLPEDESVQAYAAAQRFGFEPRTAGGKTEHPVFSGEDGRQLLEREMLIAGVRIRGFAANPKDIVRPLGYGPFSLGFGATVVTYRNCPNNCPLAWWWGDPSQPSHSPLSKWYPLFPRKVYDSRTSMFSILE